MKKTFDIKIKFNEQDARKLAIVAEKEGMTIEKLLVFLARQKISYFERTKGRISPETLKKVDISAYCEDKEEE